MATLKFSEFHKVMSQLFTLFKKITLKSAFQANVRFDTNIDYRHLMRLL